MQFTEEQRRAIEARGTNLLLSAAAGSGKTAVLVQRVLSLIEEGADVRRMLVVTFTRAAAAEMRERLAARLGEAAAEGDARLREQMLCLDRASISTLHGFCAEFLRANFEAAGVDLSLIHILEKLTLEDGLGNKAKLQRTKNNGIKIEYTSSVVL